MSDSNDRKAAKAGAGYTIGNILIRGISVISAPLYARLLTVSDYGKYNAFHAYVSIVYIILGLALHSSLKNAKNDFKEKLYEYCSNILLLIGINSLIWFILSIVFSGESFSILSLDKAILLPLLIVESFCLAIITYYNSYLSVDYKYKEYLVVSVVYSVSALLVSLCLILTIFDSERYMGRIIGTMIPEILISIYIIVKICGRNKPHIDTQQYKYALAISIPIIPHGISQIILSQFDRLMINSYIGSYESGLYSFAYTVGSIFVLVSGSLDTAWTQWFYDQMHGGNENISKIRKVTNYYVVLLTVFLCTLLLCAPELMMILGGSKYKDGVVTVFPITISMFFAFLYNIPASIEYYFKKTWFIAVGTISAAVLNIVLNLIFIPKYGYVAAAYTTLVCYLFYYVMHLFISNYINKGFLFDVRTQFVASGFVIFVGIAATNFMENIVIRLVLIALILAVMILCKGKDLYRLVSDLLLARKRQ